jgi:DegV family protein with EDD domain
MKDYLICTDSASDISPELLAEWGVKFRSLTFRFDGEDKEYSNQEMPTTEFYAKMRRGGVAKTAAVNTESFREMFEEALKDDKDILYLGFSSGLSTTYNSARLAGLALREEYPCAKIITVDTLCASAGQGLLLYLVLEKKAAGATIEEAAKYAKELVPALCHWFTVDDLVYLKRGGRISPAAAFVGNLIGIKPVLHVDDEGHLVNVEKVRGRRASIMTMASKYGELALDKEGSTIFISHADCKNDAELLANTIKERYGASVKIITDVGPVIGAHAGPGTLALFFVGKNR